MQADVGLARSCFLVLLSSLGVAELGFLSAADFDGARWPKEDPRAIVLNRFFSPEALLGFVRTVPVSATRRPVRNRFADTSAPLQRDHRRPYREIRNVMGRCLDVAGGVDADRTNVQIFDCNKTKSQMWTFENRAIRNIMGRCLDVAGGVNANRTNVQIFACNDTRSQQWTFTDRQEIRNVMGRCLDVAGGVNANRTNVQIFECNGTVSQQWK